MTADKDHLGHPDCRCKTQKPIYVLPIFYKGLFTSLMGSSCCLNGLESSQLLLTLQFNSIFVCNGPYYLKKKYTFTHTLHIFYRLPRTSTANSTLTSVSSLLLLCVPCIVNNNRLRVFFKNRAYLS